MLSLSTFRDGRPDRTLLSPPRFDAKKHCGSFFAVWTRNTRKGCGRRLAFVQGAANFVSE
jgi:hypothetical protein